MKAKRGVTLAGLKLPMRLVLIEADWVWKLYGVELVITSTLDGVHTPASLHPFGYAVDLRTRYFDKDLHKGIASQLQSILGKDYDVILHKTHIHVEYDRVIKQRR